VMGDPEMSTLRGSALAMKSVLETGQGLAMEVLLARSRWDLTQSSGSGLARRGADNHKGTGPVKGCWRYRGGQGKRVGLTGGTGRAYGPPGGGAAGLLLGRGGEVAGEGAGGLADALLGVVDHRGGEVDAQP